MKAMTRLLPWAPGRASRALGPIGSACVDMRAWSSGGWILARATYVLRSSPSGGPNSSTLRPVGELLCTREDAAAGSGAVDPRTDPPLPPGGIAAKVRRQGGPPPPRRELSVGIRSVHEQSQEGRHSCWSRDRARMASRRVRAVQRADHQPAREAAGYHRQCDACLTRLWRGALLPGWCVDGSLTSSHQPVPLPAAPRRSASPGGVSSSATTTRGVGVASARSGSPQGLTAPDGADHPRGNPPYGLSRAGRRLSRHRGRELRPRAPTRRRTRPARGAGTTPCAKGQMPPPPRANRRRAGRPNREPLVDPATGTHDVNSHVWTPPAVSLVGARQSIVALPALAPPCRCGTSARALQPVKRSRLPRHSLRPSRHQTPCRDPGRPSSCSRPVCRPPTLIACPFHFL
ncbi:hypothetical protein BFL35_16255 (plasmid) [Clavibacter michiganensis]|nr:hypothetical protein BFL35_16255 [Clavibacter michiganensis]